jgi:hypothetical protein
VERGQERLTGVRREDALGRKTWEMTAALWPAREKNHQLLRSLRDQTLLTYENCAKPAKANRPN